MLANAIRSPLVAAPVPGPTPTPADKEAQPGTAAHPFAEMLRQNRLADASPAAEPSKASTDSKTKSNADAANADDGAEPAAPGASLTQRDAVQSKARSAGASRAPTRSAAATTRSTGPAESASDRKDDGAGSASSAATDAATPAHATSAARPEPAPRPDAIASNRTDGADPSTRSAGSMTRGLDAASDGQPSGAIPLAGQTPGNSASSATESRRDALVSAADAAADAKLKATSSDERASTNPSFAEALAESKTQPHSTASSRVEGSPGAAAATTAMAEPARNVAPGADGAVTTSTVPVPVDSPEFAAAFGLQVSTLARDGVQRAELHLNPTDMGPVSIQITLDGTQARVDFGADVAATRHAIETGLPELASALRDAGFTLAGGGVTQHSASNGGQADDAGSSNPGARRSAPEAIARLDAAAQRVTRRIAAGGVDLYA